MTSTFNVTHPRDSEEFSETSENLEALPNPSPIPYSAAEYRDRDLALFNDWKIKGDKQALGKLINQLNPIMYSEVRRASGSLPTAALSAEAKKWTVQAIKTFDPSRNVLLSTHVMNYLPKVRRMNYKFQNAVRLPENMQLEYHEYSKGLNDLAEEYNRDPSEEELAKHLGWSKAKVFKFKNSLYADMIESGSERPAEFTQFNKNALFKEHLDSMLTPDERIIISDLNNKVAVSLTCQKLNVNLNRYNYLKAKLVKKVHQAKLEIGI